MQFPSNRGPFCQSTWNSSQKKAVWYKLNLQRTDKVTKLSTMFMAWGKNPSTPPHLMKITFFLVLNLGIPLTIMKLQEQQSQSELWSISLSVQPLQWCIIDIIIQVFLFVVQQVTAIWDGHGDIPKSSPSSIIGMRILREWIGWAHGKWWSWQE